MVDSDAVEPGRSVRAPAAETQVAPVHSMVGSGHVTSELVMPRRTDRPAIEPVRYRNPVFPGLDIEALTLADLRRKVPQRHLTHRSRPDFHQLLLFTRGRTPHYLDFVRHDCRAGTVLHARPGQVQQLVLQSDAEALVLLFTPAFLLPEGRPGDESSSGMLLEEAVPGGTLDLPNDVAGAVRETFDAIAAEYRSTDGGPLSRRLLQHLLHVLLLRLVRIGQGARTGRAAAVASVRTHRRFVREVERRFAHSRVVTDYARALGYSTKTLVRACLAVAGAAPKELIERRVVLESKRLLAHSGLPVGTIAAEVGFSEATNFVKFFRRREAMTPTAFRARQARRSGTGGVAPAFAAAPARQA
jgi:AraC-like DNA-binding protein